MSRYFFSLIAFSFILGGCTAETQDANAKSPTPEKAAAQAANDSPLPFSGEVAETMDAGGYTYVLVKEDKKELWAAARKFKVEKGDDVVVGQGSLMKAFTSKTLKRTFDEIWFVDKITVPGAAAAVTPSADNAHGTNPHGMNPHGAKDTNPRVSASQEGKSMDFSDVKKAKGGQNIAEIYAKAEALADKDITVQGKVVKFSANIMGKNWVHIQDGTGTAPKNDLTITTQNTVEAGQIVLVKGKLSYKKDFGSGYKYLVIIQDGEVDKVTTK